MRGKDKCRILKQIRKKIADENDIPYVIEECPYQGECKGTCPKCEAELRKMEEELSLRRRIGKGVAIVGVAAGVMATATACTPQDVVEEVAYVPFGIGHGPQVTGVAPDLTGDVGYITEGEAMPYPDDIQGGLEINKDATDYNSPD